MVEAGRGPGDSQNCSRRIRSTALPQLAGGFRNAALKPSLCWQAPSFRRGLTFDYLHLHLHTQYDTVRGGPTKRESSPLFR